MDFSHYFRAYSSSIARPLLGIAFFLLFVLLFPIITDLDKSFLPQLAPGVIWFAALFVRCLQLPEFLKEDHQSGLLECMIASPRPLAISLLVKLMAYSLVHTLPLMLLVPLLALMYDMTLPMIGWLWVGLWLGLPLLDLIGATIAALLLNVRQGGLLLVLLVLPLFVPITLLAVGLVTAVVQGQSPTGLLFLLLGINCLSFAVFPLLLSYCVNIGIE